MSGHDNKLIRIEAASCSLRPEVQSQWKLEVLWKFENLADATVYLLLDMPLVTRLTNPLILDHALFDTNAETGVNVEPTFEIVGIPQRAVLERRLTYSLSLPESWNEVTVIGRFGCSLTRPDSKWVEQQNRSQVARWLQPVNSEPFSMELIRSDG